MKKIILSLVVVFSVWSSGSLFAQNQNPGQMQQMMKQYLKDTVKLTAIQVDSVMSARMRSMPQLKELYKNEALSPGEKQAKVKDIRSQLEESYKSAGLKDDQVKMIEDHDARMRQQMRNRMGGGQSN